MNTKNAWTLATAALGAGLLTTTILLWNENRDLRSEQATLRAAMNQAGTQRPEPSGAQITPEELARLRATESEVLRLRNQVGLLRRELAQRTTAQGSQRPPEAAEQTTPAPTNQADGAFEAKVNARIPKGQTLAFGGWTTESGKRAVAFVEPEVEAGSGSNAQVVVRTTLLEVPPEVWSQLGVPDIQTDPQLSSQNALLSQPQAESLISSLTNEPNCVITSRPKLQTSDGVAATMFIGETMSSNHLKGQLLDFLTQLDPDGSTVHLTLAMKFGPQGQ